jgi:hypothetical protein
VKFFHDLRGGALRPGGCKVTSEESDRLLAACRLLGGHPDEERLLHAEVARVVLFQSQTADTYELYFADGSKGAFKSIEGAERSAAGYGHTAASAVLNDVAAWLTARGLGFDHLLRGVVITTCSHENAGLGSLQHWFLGEPSGLGWERSSDLRSAALLDAVIGHQHRNPTNFKFDDGTDELGLYDNSFAFALPGHQTNASVILEQAHSADASLESDLVSALDRCAGSEERRALELVLAPDRFAAVVARCERMEASGELLAPLDF